MDNLSKIQGQIALISTFIYQPFPPSTKGLFDIIQEQFCSQANERMEPAKVVVRYRDGRIIKGYTQDFLPTHPSFHAYPFGPSTSTEAVDILVRDLKAIFFVRDFSGDPNYHERKEFFEGAKIIGKVLEVTFKDGEVIVGSSLRYDPERPGFFISPADPKGNNLGVFVVTEAVSKVRYL